MSEASLLQSNSDSRVCCRAIQQSMSVVAILQQLRAREPPKSARNGRVLSLLPLQQQIVILLCTRSSDDAPGFAAQIIAKQSRGKLGRIHECDRRPVR